MDTETLWNEILQALEAEIPRASYETWVRGTRGIAWEGGVLTVAAHSGYAREWLENRVWAKAMRKLLELQPGAQDLRFVVAEEEESEEEVEAEGEDVEAETETEVETEAETSEIEISAEAGSLYEQAVRPERAVYLPGYFQRWLKALGPDLGWFYVGFRQAAYRAGGRSGQKSGRFSGKQIARLCGITERTFWNRVRSDAVWQRLNGLVSRNDQRYGVAMSLPLTAADTRALARWLTDHLEACGGAQGAVEAACQAPAAELLADDPAAEAEGFAPMTIAQLLRQMFPEADLKGQAERLRMHLMPQRDQIVISLFFLEHILPWLGAGAGWVYVLLRDRCYAGASGQERDTVLVRGGYREMAAWLGSSRPQTVYDWLRKPVVRVYVNGRVKKQESAGADKWESPLQFRVLLNDVPPEIVQAAAQGDSNAIFSFGRLGVTQISVYGNANFSVPVTQFSVSGNANFIPPVTQISEFSNAIFSTLKLLNSDSNSLKLLQTHQPAPRNAKTAQAAAAPSVGREGEPQNLGLDSGDSGNWDFEGILQRLNVNKSSRRRLREQNVSERDFVSWLLQAATMRNVDPVRIAVAWSLNPYRRESAGEDYRLLAQMPGGLRAAARKRALGLQNRYSLEAAGSESEADRLYRRALGGDADTAAWLLRVLFGEETAPEKQTAGFAAVLQE
jgi:hypothetical protein